MLFVTFEFTDLSVFIETCNVFKCINRVNIGFNWLFRGMRINICNRPCMLPVYFFWCGLSSHSSMFHSYGDITFACEELQILTYARHT